MYVICTSTDAGVICLRSMDKDTFSKDDLLGVLSVDNDQLLRWADAGETDTWIPLQQSIEGAKIHITATWQQLTPSLVDPKNKQV